MEKPRGGLYSKICCSRGVESISVVLGLRRERSFEVWGRSHNPDTRVGLAGGYPLLDQAHVGELVLEVVGSCWVLSASGALSY